MSFVRCLCPCPLRQCLAGAHDITPWAARCAATAPQTWRHLSCPNASMLASPPCGYCLLPTPRTSSCETLPTPVGSSRAPSHTQRGSNPSRRPRARVDHRLLLGACTAIAASALAGWVTQGQATLHCGATRPHRGHGRSRPLPCGTSVS